MSATNLNAENKSDKELTIEKNSSNNKLKHDHIQRNKLPGKPRDLDSGCPASDRSTGISHLPSLDPMVLDIDKNDGSLPESYEKKKPNRSSNDEDLGLFSSFNSDNLNSKKHSNSEEIQNYHKDDDELSLDSDLIETAFNSSSQKKGEQALPDISQPNDQNIQNRTKLHIKSKSSKNKHEIDLNKKINSETFQEKFDNILDDSDICNSYSGSNTHSISQEVCSNSMSKNSHRKLKYNSNSYNEKYVEASDVSEISGSTITSSSQIQAYMYRLKKDINLLKSQMDDLRGGTFRKRRNSTDARTHDPSNKSKQMKPLKATNDFDTSCSEDISINTDEIIKKSQKSCNKERSSTKAIMNPIIESPLKNNSVSRHKIESSLKHHSYSPVEDENYESSSFNELVAFIPQSTPKDKIKFVKDCLPSDKNSAYSLNSNRTSKSEISERLKTRSLPRQKKKKGFTGDDDRSKDFISTIVPKINLNSSHNPGCSVANKISKSKSTSQLSFKCHKCAFARNEDLSTDENSSQDFQSDKQANPNPFVFIQHYK